MAKIELVIAAHEKDLGGFSVRRMLPYAIHKMVGPFIFFDHIGPAVFPVGHGIDVRPHPHINLATVTFLFTGKIRHRDSLGSDQLIEPGAINWMTAGHGIVHSERTPEDLRQQESHLHGIQCWVALPEQQEEVAPSFKHYPAATLPDFTVNGVQIKLLLGSILNHQSPVAILSELFYASAQFKTDQELFLPVNGCESGVYVINGKVRVNDKEIDQYQLAVISPCESVTIVALEESCIMILGGKSVGTRYIYWNFVASSIEKIEKAKLDWTHGPGDNQSRFPKIPTDNQEFIPLPDESGDHPKGTIM